MSEIRELTYHPGFRNLNGERVALRVRYLAPTATIRRTRNGYFLQFVEATNTGQPEQGFQLIPLRKIHTL